MSKKLVLIATVFLVLSTGAAFADSITLGPGLCGGNVPQNNCGNFTFTVSNPTATSVSFTLHNGNADSWFLQYFSLHVIEGTAGFTATASGSNPYTSTLFYGQGNNSQPVGGCSGSGTPLGAFCVIVNGGGIGAGATQTYTFDFTNGTVLDTSDWHLQLMVTDNDCSETAKNCNPRVVLSTGPASQVPEPASMALLGTGMIGLAGAARRRFKK